MPDVMSRLKVLQEGKCSQGGQKKRYKDTFKASLNGFDIPIRSWEQAAQERSKWRGIVNKGATKKQLIMKKRESVKLKTQN